MYGIQYFARGYLLCPTPGRGCDVSMNSYDRDGDVEKLRVMVGRDDCCANLEATGLKLLRVFILKVRRCRESTENYRNSHKNRTCEQEQ